MKRIGFLVCVLLISVNVSNSQDSLKTDLSKFFKGHDGAFVVYDRNKDGYIRYNPERCAQRFLPASTFKIPNALIGLETGVIADSNYVIKWDGRPEPIKEWERDHDLKSAIYYSVVPYFQELARRVGRERMQHWLDTLNYGNKTIGDKIDFFWLNSSLQISADEEVEFLKKLYSEKLPLSKRSMDIVIDILPTEHFGKATMKSKTGTGHTSSDHFIAWLVGYVEKEGHIYFFAFNIDAKDFSEATSLRDSIPKQILKQLGILD